MRPLLMSPLLRAGQQLGTLTTVSEHALLRTAWQQHKAGHMQASH